MAGLHNLLINEFTIESLLWLLLYKRETDSGTLKKCYARRNNESMLQHFMTRGHKMHFYTFIIKIGTCTWRTPRWIMSSRMCFSQRVVIETLERNPKYYCSMQLINFLNYSWIRLPALNAMHVPLKFVSAFRTIQAFSEGANL